jgi:hypothetical protein
MQELHSAQSESSSNASLANTSDLVILGNTDLHNLMGPHKNEILSPLLPLLDTGDFYYNASFLCRTTKIWR